LKRPLGYKDLPTLFKEKERWFRASQRGPGVYASAREDGLGTCNSVRARSKKKCKTQTVNATIGRGGGNSEKSQAESRGERGFMGKKSRSGLGAARMNSEGKHGPLECCDGQGRNIPEHGTSIEDGRAHGCHSVEGGYGEIYQGGTRQRIARTRKHCRPDKSEAAGSRRGIRRSSREGGEKGGKIQTSSKRLP